MRTTPVPVRIERALYDKLVRRAELNRRSVTQELAVILTESLQNGETHNGN